MTSHLLVRSSASSGGATFRVLIAFSRLPPVHSQSVFYFLQHRCQCRLRQMAHNIACSPGLMICAPKGWGRDRGVGVRGGGPLCLGSNPHHLYGDSLRLSSSWQPGSIRHHPRGIPNSSSQSCSEKGHANSTSIGSSFWRPAPVNE